jgi:hemerythrin superfamily protein
MPNAIEHLVTDHERLRALLPKLADHGIAADERKKLLEAVEQEIKMHALLEEEIFYPAFKEAASEREDRDMYFEAIEEHHVLDMLLPELKPLHPSTDGFRAKASVLRELLEHHADEEERDMFPKATALLGEARLLELGARMDTRRAELEKQWESTVGGLLRKAQSVAEKFAPTKMKDKRVDAHMDDDK